MRPSSQLKILDYHSPSLKSAKINVKAAASTGLPAGAITFASAFVVGPDLYLGVGAILGVFAAAITAHYSWRREFRGAMIANTFASFSFQIIAWTSQLLFGTLASLRFEPMSMMLSFAGCWALFAIPGLLGSFWVWEGRRPREWDEKPPTE